VDRATARSAASASEEGVNMVASRAASRKATNPAAARRHRGSGAQPAPTNSLPILG